METAQEPSAQSAAATGRSLLVVAGSGRSGTSLFSGLAHRLGQSVPQPEVVADRNNPKGFGEPQWAVDFDRRMLRKLGVQLGDTRPEAWDMAFGCRDDAPAARELRAWLDGEFAQCPRLSVKDPHLTWILPLYLDAARSLGAHVPIATMVRHPIENIKSRKLAYGEGRSSTTRLAGWVNVMLHLEHRTRGMSRAFLRYEELLEDWQQTLAMADRSLGLDLLGRATDEQLAEAGALVDPGLRRSQGSWDEFGVPAALQEIAEESWRALGSLATGEADEATHRDLDELRHRWDALHEDSREISASVQFGARRQGRQAAASKAAPSAPVAEAVPALKDRVRRRLGVERRRAGALVRRVRGGRIRFLILDLSANGGIVRFTSTLASALADTHDVEIISVVRAKQRPRHALDPRVRVTYLVDQHPALRGYVGGPGGKVRAFEDRAVREALAALPPGVLITDRPESHEVASASVPADVHVMAVIHSAFAFWGDRPKELIKAAAPRVAALVTLTEDDRERWATYLGPSSAPIRTIPNAIPAVSPAPAPLDAKVIVAAGALVANKGFDRLITIFAELSEQYPDWELHVHGAGPERAALEKLAADHDVAGRVRFHGFTEDLARAMGEASIYALGSHYESFSLSMLEAMGAGLPVVAFDADPGPRNLMEHEGSGLLVSQGDHQAFRDALARLMDDSALRRRMGQRGREIAASYEAKEVASAWEALFEQFTGRGARGRRASHS